MIRTITLIALVCSLIGCKSVKPYAANASGESVAKSTAFIAAASANIDAAKPDTGKTGKVLLNVANDYLGNATKENAEAGNQIHATQKQLSDISAVAYDYHHSWFGGKFRRLAWWTKVVMVVVLAALVATRQNVLGWALMAWNCIWGTIKFCVSFVSDLIGRLFTKPKAKGKK